MIAIIDYGMGNLGSVYKALNLLGFPAQITDRPAEVKQAEGVILPGVGAFADAMTNLRNLGMDEAVKQVIADGRPFLGICLGMQLLMSWSEENDGQPGLDIIPGQVKKLPPGMKIPHMGWNDWVIKQNSPLLSGLEDGCHCYFVHSYYVEPEDSKMVLTSTEYTTWFPSIIGQNRMFATQFHPEKSGRVGLQLLKNFGELVGA